MRGGNAMILLLSRRESRQKTQRREVRFLALSGNRKRIEKS